MKELFICDYEGRKLIGLLEEYELTEIYEEEKDNQSIEGNIYIGKVQNVITGLQSAFVDIGEKKNAFIHVKDILPKVDITKEKAQTHQNIEELIKQGDLLVVEVKKEAVDKKGPRLSTHINLVSKLVVFMPNANFITISQKIEDEAEKERLKNIVQKYIPSGTGVIVRTDAVGKSEDEIKRDIEYIVKKWESIKNTNVENAPMLIFNKGGIIKKTITDLADSGIDKIVVQDEEDKPRVEKILEEIDSKVNIEIDKDILTRYDIESQIKAASHRKVWLKSGGFISIDKTEALVAIDVNSGKYTGKKDLEKTIVNVNLEAVYEIAKQIRLRDISGIIVIDFIDMMDDEDKKFIISEMKKAIKKDRSKVQIEDFTKLNLMEVTRKHINSKKFEIQ